MRNTEISYNRPLNFVSLIQPRTKYLGNNSFQFLNLEKDFKGRIDWTFSEYGKLWTYNLEYFDYIHQENVEIDEKVRLIHDFYRFCATNKRTLEPYPVSLRAINLIKFTCVNNLGSQEFHQYVYQELSYLDNNYEFHILINYLL